MFNPAPLSWRRGWGTSARTKALTAAPPPRSCRNWHRMSNSDSSVSSSRCCASPSLATSRSTWGRLSAGSRSYRCWAWASMPNRLHVNAVVVVRVADRSSRRSLAEQRVFSSQPVRAAWICDAASSDQSDRRSRTTATPMHLLRHQTFMNAKTSAKIESVPCSICDTTSSLRMACLKTEASTATIFPAMMTVRRTNWKQTHITRLKACTPMITTRSTHCPRIGARMAAANHSCKFPPPGRTTRVHVRYCPAHPGTVYVVLVSTVMIVGSKGLFFGMTSCWGAHNQQPVRY